MSEPYENTLTAEQLRVEVRRLWDEGSALTDALRALPDVPSLEVLRALSGAAMNIHDPDLMALGKALQRKHGLDAVPPKTERECAAGLWSIIRAALVAARTGK